ncbi:epoxide hydrolase [Nakamurella flavida]|uniref:Epoxide hydrolase n=1 Tax=Nakamurella flavida TaxID=363630 RepID=A0A939C1H2_9ACTN|nr:epoxide hydrolase family protein [Nakamurella flavida]MBM9477688.1 epoxide hydrolase [Nakamurella flavida]MDP9779240.1 pimeloyl-ACP methyl ester carboxylesterase [Nakamurella flavida]
MALPPAAPPAVDEAVLDDLRARLAAFRAVPLPAGHGWSRGVDPGYLTELVTWWRDEYDWRAAERTVRELPWAVAGVGDSAVRAVLRTGSTPGLPVLFLHGWPDSVLRFTRVLAGSADLTAVVPALPGYPFAAPTRPVGMSAADTAHLLAAAMTEWGFPRFVVSAGDVGCDVAEVLAAEYPERVAALHLTDVSQHHFLRDGLADDATDEERAYLARGQDWQRREGGYSHEQSTRPQTLAVGLGDSPAGLAAWIVDKLRSWSDCGGDVESVFPREDLLTWVTAYWVSGAIGTSFTPYVDQVVRPDRFPPPAVFTVFPRDLVNAPRAFAERMFDVRAWTEHEHGGHFAAWECPQDYLAGVRAAVALAGGSTNV